MIVYRLTTPPWWTDDPSEPLTFTSMEAVFYPISEQGANDRHKAAMIGRWRIQEAKDWRACGKCLNQAYSTPFSKPSVKPVSLTTSSSTRSYAPKSAKKYY